MAGSGKTSYVSRLISELKCAGKKVYSINLDPAVSITIFLDIMAPQVTKIPYTANIGILETR